jgi:hypothetical protein
MASSLATRSPVMVQRRETADAEPVAKAGSINPLAIMARLSRRLQSLRRTINSLCHPIFRVIAQGYEDGR